MFIASVANDRKIASLSRGQRGLTMPARLRNASARHSSVEEEHIHYTQLDTMENSHCR